MTTAMGEKRGVDVDLPDSLPIRLYLLAYRADRRRVVGGSQLGLVIRAAALADLLCGGHLMDDQGKPRATGRRLADPVLDTVYQEVAADKRRSWQAWVQRGARGTADAVREQLAGAGTIDVETERVLGLFRRYRVTVRDPRLVDALHRRVTEVLSNGRPADRLDPRDAAMVALAAVGELRTVLTGRERRQHRRRIKELREQAGPAVVGLRKAISAYQASVAG